ncbi:MAG: hypothetical protein KDA41_05160 [Planctomycetales bacterium]|nr:hypothetical protein [Planctomycetales bacterium]
MAVVLITSDLMIPSALAGAARASGTVVRNAGGVEAACTLAAEGDIDAFLLDLAAVGADVTASVARLRACSGSPRVVAFGPHVHAEKLAAARAAGCDAVLTRGQFHAQMESVLQDCRRG